MMVLPTSYCSIPSAARILEAWNSSTDETKCVFAQRTADNAPDIKSLLQADANNNAQRHGFRGGNVYFPKPVSLNL